MPYVYFIALGTIFFIVWAEYSVGSILFRPGQTGEIRIIPTSMINFMMSPFHQSHLWNMTTLDINYPFFIGYTVLILVIQDFTQGCR